MFSDLCALDICDENPKAVADPYTEALSNACGTVSLFRLLFFLSVNNYIKDKRSPEFQRASHIPFTVTGLKCITAPL